MEDIRREDSIVQNRKLLAEFYERHPTKPVLTWEENDAHKRKVANIISRGIAKHVLEDALKKCKREPEEVVEHEDTPNFDDVAPDENSI